MFQYGVSIKLHSSLDVIRRALYHVSKQSAVIDMYVFLMCTGQ